MTALKMLAHSRRTKEGEEEKRSVLAGSLIILGLFLSIAYGKVRTKNAYKNSRI
jgi:hypothetical protein